MAPPNFPITKWDNQKLNELSGRVSVYLHWSGGLNITTQSVAWFDAGISVVGAAAGYVWDGLTTGNTGVMSINRLEPEMREIWGLYSNGEISIEDAVQRADRLEPIFRERIAKRN